MFFVRRLLCYYTATPILMNCEGSAWINVDTNCYNDLLTGKTPQLSALNFANILTYDNYPTALEDFTVDGEYVIAKRRAPFRDRDPAIAVIAVRLRTITHCGTYGGHSCIRPSPDLRVQDAIKVLWVANVILFAGLRR
jgi:hypothetical protein